MDTWAECDSSSVAVCVKYSSDFDGGLVCLHRQLIGARSARSRFNSLDIAMNLTNAFNEPLGSVYLSATPDQDGMYWWGDMNHRNVGVDPRWRRLPNP